LICDFFRTSIGVRVRVRIRSPLNNNGGWDSVSGEDLDLVTMHGLGQPLLIRSSRKGVGVRVRVRVRSNRSDRVEPSNATHPKYCVRIAGIIGIVIGRFWFVDVPSIGFSLGTSPVESVTFGWSLPVRSY